MRCLFIFGAVLSVLIVGCAPQEGPEGMWRAVLEVPGGELPFGIEVTEEGDKMQAFLRNGTERVPIRDVTWTDAAVHLRLPAFNTVIEATPTERGIDGTLTLIKEEAKPQVIPFTATPNTSYRFFAETDPPAADVSGRWAVTFVEADTIFTDAIGEFLQDGKQVYGTFITKTGDYRFLEGTLDGNNLYLSCFDGAHAFLFKATLQADNTLAGDFWSGTHWHETWTAYRDAEARLPDATTLTYLNEGYDRFNFTFPDVDSNLVSLTDERFQNKVTLVTLSGTWCPNCHDKATFLADYHRQNKGRGLEVVSLMYEHLEAFDEAAEQVREFRSKFNIEHELLIAGISDKAEASETLPMLNHVLAYPTTIYVDRQGAVRKIHTGFTGPGTGEHYEAYKSEFYAFVDSLLAE